MTTTKKIFLFALPVFILGLMFTFVAVKKISPLSTLWWGEINTVDNVAAHQYDVVSYFSGQATKGEKQFTANFEGVNYYFSNKENLAAFIATPVSYTPQFGAFCALAVSKGFTADTDPNAWTVIDEKLYLFTDQNVKQEWLDGIKQGTLTMSHNNWDDKYPSI